MVYGIFPDQGSTCIGRRVLYHWTRKAPVIACCYETLWSLVIKYILSSTLIYGLPVSYMIIAQLPSIKSSLFPRIFWWCWIIHCPSNLFSFLPPKMFPWVCPFLLSLSAPSLPLLFRDLLRGQIRGQLSGETLPKPHRCILKTVLSVFPEHCK